MRDDPQGDGMKQIAERAQRPRHHYRGCCVNFMEAPMTDRPLEIRTADWLDDHEVNERSPLYLWLFNSFSDVLGAARRIDVGDDIIANALLNLYVRAVADLRPTDAQVAQVAQLFADAVIAIRDQASETRQV
jgi:hypothetical protein